MLLQENSTNDREKRYNFTRRPRSLMNVLRRPVETAVNTSRSFYTWSNGWFRPEADGRFDGSDR